MRVLMLTDWRGRGGAAIAAERLAQSLESLGHDVRWAYGRTTDMARGGSDLAARSLPAEAAVRLTGRFWPRVSRRMQQAQMVARLDNLIRQCEPDVISVHNLHAVDLPATLPALLSRRTPVVWTLHDMWAFTGGCTYSFDCDGYRRNCAGQCPQQIGARNGVKPALALTRRRNALQRAGQFAAVTPSRWLAELARRGLFRNTMVEPIANSVDLHQFRPADRLTARRALGVSASGPLILSASASLHDPRKGTDVLLKALELRPDRPVTWLTLGDGRPDNLPGHVTHHAVGHVDDPRLMALAYSAADVHVLPTRADNLPNVLLEAAACGTPSIASRVGGIPEVIIPDMTGWTFPVGDPAGLSSRLDLLFNLQPERHDDLRLRCRWYAHEHFSPAIQGQAYTRLFNQLCSAAARSAA